MSTRQSSLGSGESGFATTTGSRPAEPTVATTRETSGRLASSTIAFGSPMRRLRPPANTAPTVTGRFIYPVSHWISLLPEMSAAPLEIDAARRLVLERVTALGSEAVAVAEALGRTLAEDVISADPVPGFDNSAMDGYAVRAADTADGPESPADGRRRVEGRPPGGSRARRRRGDRDLDRRDAARRRRRRGPGRGHRRPSGGRRGPDRGRAGQGRPPRRARTSGRGRRFCDRAPRSAPPRPV